MVAEQARHFLRGLEKAFGIGGEQAARLGDGGLPGNAGEDIVQRPLFRGCVERVVGGDKGDTGFLGEVVQSGEMALVGTGPRHGGTQPDMGGEGAELVNKPLPFKGGGRGGI